MLACFCTRQDVKSGLSAYQTNYPTNGNAAALSTLLGNHINGDYLGSGATAVNGRTSLISAMQGIKDNLDVGGYPPPSPS